MFPPSPRLRGALIAGAVLLAAMPGQAQRYRKTKKLEPAAKITVTVEKAANGNPVSNAAVVFRASKNGKAEGSMEVKTNPDGQATIDIIEVGSHVQVQVIADGFSTAAEEFDVPSEEKDVTIKLLKPRAQVSAYENNDSKPSDRPAGIQEPRHIAQPKKKPAASASTAAPATVDVPVSSPDPKAKPHPDNAPTSSPQ